MNRPSKSTREAKRSGIAAALALSVAGLALAGCDDSGGDPRKQIGANPVLPGLQQYLVPPIQIAKPISWGNDTPKVSAGLRIHALATGFQHPRSLYVLPNGDVLVVESNGPKHLSSVQRISSPPGRNGPPGQGPRLPIASRYCATPTVMESRTYEPCF
jgi:glucose/arabinose dehydrogenase